MGCALCKSPNTGADLPDRGEFRVISDACDRACKDLGEVSVHARYHRKKVLTDDYEVDVKAVLGVGYNGIVYTAKAKVGGNKFAVKDFRFRTFTQTQLHELAAECEIYLSMDHPHVVRLVNVYHAQDRVSLVMECLEGGQLSERAFNAHGLPSESVADVAYQMLLAVCYLHEHNIVHRDIKLENWLYDTRDGDNLKLIDFGFSTMAYADRPMHVNVGTVSYVAPEVILKNYDSKCDVWSLGVCVFTLLSGYLPFDGDSTQDIMRSIIGCKIASKSSWEERVKDDPEASDFVMSLLKKNVQQRLSAQQALKHEFITMRSKRWKQHSKGQDNVDSATICNLCAFAHAPKFRRAVMDVLAWSLSAEDCNDLKEVFISMDTDHIGSLTVKEFRDAVESKFTIPHEDVDRMFQSLHDAGQEEIHYSEFLAAMVSSKISVYHDLLYAAFQRFDENSKGFIDQADCHRVFGKACSDDDIQQFIDSAGSNGRVNYDEFTEFAKAGAVACDDFLERLLHTDGSLTPPASPMRKPTKPSY